jgi:hypothetical protein
MCTGTIGGCSPLPHGHPMVLSAALQTLQLVITNVFTQYHVDALGSPMAVAMPPCRGAQLVISHAYTHHIWLHSALHDSHMGPIRRPAASVTQPTTGILITAGRQSRTCNWGCLPFAKKFQHQNKKVRGREDQSENEEKPHCCLRSEKFYQHPITGPSLPKPLFLLVFIPVPSFLYTSFS